MAAYSLDLRERIVDAVERGLGTRSEVAGRFGVHESFAYKLLRQKRQRGDLAPLPHVSGAEVELNKISCYSWPTWWQNLRMRPWSSCASKSRSKRAEVSVLTIWRALDALGLSRKKTRSGRRLDNVKFHHSARAISLIKAAGASVLHIPAYPPDFNPIEATGPHSRRMSAVRISA